MNGLLTLADYQDIPKRLKLRGFEVSCEEYVDQPGLMTVTVYHPKYTRWRKRRHERTLQRIKEYVHWHKIAGFLVEVRLQQGPRTKPEWYMHQTRPAILFIDGKRIGEVHDVKIAREIDRQVFNELVGREAISGEWIEHCDVCGKELDQMNSEDFYIEAERKVLCEEHYREWREQNDGRNDNTSR